MSFLAQGERDTGKQICSYTSATPNRKIAQDRFKVPYARNLVIDGRRSSGGAFPSKFPSKHATDLSIIMSAYCKNRYHSRLLQKCFLVGSGWSISSRHRQGFDIV